ncbi:MAG: hypothetical protein QME81_11925 [bacterium]|nr:hypothetical protein [bacterium]
MRIIKEIEIGERKANALFDTGAMHTYVKEDILCDAQKLNIPKSYKVALGGRNIEVHELYFVWGEIEGLGFDMEVVSVDELGRADGKELDAIIGALTMEKWEIIPNPKEGTLDLEGLKRREFIEF